MSTQASQRQTNWGQTAIRYLCALFALWHLGIAPLPLAAQSDRPPVVRITGVDTSQFPEVAIQVYGENLPTALETLAAAVSEDGAPISVTSDNTAQGLAGTQTAIVFDAAGSIVQNGPTNEPIYIEVGKILRKLVPLGVLSSDRDFLTTIAFGSDKQPAVLHRWSQDHQAAVDSIYQYKPVEGIRNTSIDGILRFTLEQLADPTLPPGQVQSIVLFSDGIDVFPVQGLFDALQLAQARNVRIHTVMIGRERAEPRKNLEDLARQTGGSFVHLNSTDALNDFWPRIAQAGTRRVLTYRSQQEKPSKVAVALTLPDNKVITVDSIVSAPPLAPAQITIIAPAPGAEIRKEAPAYDTPIQQLNPKALEVQAVIEFPDGHPRTVRSFEYEVAGRVEALPDKFDQPYLLDIASLKSGEYSIRARLVDELGKTALSEALPFTIREVRPPEPTATPDPQATANAIKAQEEEELRKAEELKRKQAEAAIVVEAAGRAEAEWWQQILTLSTGGASLLALVMAGVAYYIWSNPARRKAVTQVITGTVAAVTQPFIRPQRRGGRGEQPRAQFRLVDNGGVDDAPQSIPLTRSGITIGRDPTVATIVLSDRHVSKLHCRVIEDGNAAGYRLLDEGSTSGTYVNDQEVDINGQILRHGDIIAIGPLQYQFELTESSNSRRHPEPETNSGPTNFETQAYIRPGEKGKTEPYGAKREN